MPGTAIATPPASSALRRRGWRALACALLGLIILGLVAETLRVVVGGNFHTLIPGQIYRSAQPSARQIEQLARDYGIRTVVNLRGRNDGFDWYEAEAQVCQALGLSHENLTYSAIRLPSKHELRRLIEILDRAERPLLLHCRQGADRTGLASAVALLLTPDVPYIAARSKMGLRWGHWPWGPAGKLSEFFEQYERWLADQSGSNAASQHSAAQFRLWARDVYAGNLCQYEVIAFLTQHESARADEPLSFRARFRNTSPQPWQFRAIGRAGIHLGIQVVSADRSFLWSGKGGLLDKTVGPGEEIELTVAVPPLKAGRYRLRVDLVAEGHAWFHQLGQEPIEEELIVRE